MTREEQDALLGIVTKTPAWSRLSASARGKALAELRSGRFKTPDEAMGVLFRLALSEEVARLTIDHDLRSTLLREIREGRIDSVRVLMERMSALEQQINARRARGARDNGSGQDASIEASSRARTTAAYVVHRTTGVVRRLNVTSGFEDWHPTLKTDELLVWYRFAPGRRPQMHDRIPLGDLSRCTKKASG